MNLGRKDLIGKNLIVTPIRPELQKYGYTNFIKNPNIYEHDSQNIVYPDENKTHSIYDSLANKKFKCVDVIKKSMAEYFLKLEKTPNDYIYYAFNITQQNNLPFKSQDELEKQIIEQDSIKSLIQERKDPCSHIEYSYEKIEKIKTYSSPYSNSDDWQLLPVNERISKSIIKYPIIYEKVIRNGKATYYMSIRAESSVPTILKRGVILLLSNGVRINKPAAKIDCNVDEYGYGISSFITLTELDLKQLRKYPITDFKLFAETEHVKNPELFMKYLNCLTSKK